MNTQTQSIEALVECSHVINPVVLSVHAPIKLLILDRANGPANIVFDVFGRLFAFGVTLTVANTREDVLYALNCYKIDLLAIGLETHNLETLALVSSIRDEYPDLPVVGIGRELSSFQRTQCQQFGLENILALPQRAGELKALLRVLMQQYLLE